MKSDRIDYKRKEKILTGSVITSTAVLLGLYLNNGTVVKADSLPNGQDVTQTASSANTEAGNSTNQNENSASGTGSTNSTQTGTNTGSSNSTDQNENSATGTTNDTQTGTTTSPTEETTGQAISDAGDLTRSTRTFRWKGTDGVGVDLTFDDTTGELTIPGGTEANPVVLTNPAFFSSFLYTISDKIKKITITGKLKIIGSSAYLFYNLSNLTTITGLDQIDTSEVTSMNNLFSECKSLTSIDLSKFDTSRVTDMANMFLNASKLTSLDVSHFDTSKVTNMQGMFNRVSKVTNLDVSHFDTSKVTNMQGMFGVCSGLTSLDVTNFDTSNVTDMSLMFNAIGSATLDVSHFDTSKVTNMWYMFGDSPNLTSLDLTNFKTANVTDMSYMFYKCGNLTNIDVSHFDTSKVTTMQNMFALCTALTNIDVSHFDTGNVINMNSMFLRCKSLTSLDVSHFNTDNVTIMYQMFSECANLTSLDVSHFNTANVTNMIAMFSKCFSLTELDLRNFDTSKATYMNDMFYSCENLTKLNISSFDMSKIWDSKYAVGKMLSGLTNLRVIVLGPKCYLQYTGLRSDGVSRTGTSSLIDPNSNWVNVADGTIEKPKGNKAWTVTDLETKYNGPVDQDTYVRWCTVKAHYQDETGKQLIADKVINGLYGEDYTNETKVNIPGYTLKEVRGDTTGTYGDRPKPKEVTYVYTKNPVMSKVTVHYQDENSNQIASDEVLTGKVGDGYQTMQKTISGYTFKEVKGGATGTIEETAKEVTYVYTKNPVMSKVTVHYQDENGNQIASDEVLTGKVGDNYQSVQKTINGYTFKEVKGGATGTIEETAKEVTYVYIKNPNSPVVPVTTSKVTVHYQDENGNQIASDEVLTGKVGNNYQSTQKTINGYTFKEVRGNATGFFSANEQTVTYIYTKDDETATTTLPNYVPKPAKPNRNKPNNTNKLTGTNNQTATDKNQQKVAKSLAGDPNEAKTDSLSQTGASNEDKGILSILGSMMLLVSSIGGAWFKRKQK